MYVTARTEFVDSAQFQGIVLILSLNYTKVFLRTSIFLVHDWMGDSKNVYKYEK